MSGGKVENILGPLRERLLALSLQPEEIARLFRSPYQCKVHSAGSVIGQERSQPDAWFIASGWASCQSILMDGKRQILGFALPGDLGGRLRNHVVDTVALTSVTIVEFRLPAADASLKSVLQKVTARAWEEKEAYLLNHILRLGSMTAMQRMAHLFLELRDRLQTVGLADKHHFPLPITQEALAEALGLSSVHVNRVLSQLRREDLIGLGDGIVVLKDAAFMRSIAEGSALAPSEYLASALPAKARATL